MYTSTLRIDNLSNYLLSFIFDYLGALHYQSPWSLTSK
jgi:hypothetical protein